jgi:hypothetical protein
MAALLSPEVLARLAQGVSVIVASRDAQLRPSLMRAVGSRIEEGGQAVTVYLSRRQSRQLLQDLAATGQVAAVFSVPSTHQTVQLKASKVEMRPAGPADAPVLQEYLAAMEQEIQRVGFAPPLTRAMLAHRLDEVVAVRFAPEQAFDQTPGPRAGAALGSRP